ncbi:MAG: methionine--tRNA ligase, partial [Planctomycetes bacterium]|nr:methionine--tRNA ligase [Planctomycetota bacterium]
MAKELKDKYLITAALPYANGKLHVGHIAGAYLPADIFTRFLRSVGKETYFVCGTDENGAPITFSAMKEKVTPQEIIDRYHAIARDAFKGLGVDFNIFGRTHCPRHDEISQEFFTRLHDKGHIVKRTTEQVYCKSCDMFLPDRYIEGTCYHSDCKKPGARGDQCEACGRPIDATKLVDPECMVCKMQGKDSKGNIEVREVDHWYLRLDTFESDLRAYLDKHPEWRETVKRFSYGLLDQGLKERAISRDLDWGCPVPLDEAEGKVLYVWFDAPIGYITFTRQYFESIGEGERWKEFWQEENSGLVHFIGKDNTVFHAVMFPGMLLAHGDYRLADEVVSNEFLNLEGDKISTSRDYAVWVDNYLEHFAPDPLRYYLTAIAPEASDSDFSWKDFQARNNGEIADNIGNFIQRNLTFTKKYFDGKVPGKGNMTEAGNAMLEEIDKARDEIYALLADYRFKNAQERLMRLSQRGNQYFAEETPWQSRKTDMAACGTTIYVGLRVVE